MLDCKEAYELICEAINRKDKFDEFDNTFGQNKTYKKNDNVKLKRVKQEDNYVEVKRFATNLYKAPIINYKGHVSGKSKVNNTRYSEVIADTLISKGYIKTWLELQPLRPNHFDTGHNHSESIDINKLQISNRKEEILAKLLFYQREVKDLGYNSKDKCYSIIELKYRPSGSEETLLRCVLEAYTYYKLFDLNQIESAQNHKGINELRALNDYKRTKNAELVILFDEKSRTKEDGGKDLNLMLRVKPKLDPKTVDTASYPSETVISQQYKECLELVNTDKRDSLRTLCKTILEQEPNLKQIRFVVLRVDSNSKKNHPEYITGWDENLDRFYRAETLLTISK